MTNEVFEAGVGRADITPPIGIMLVGYAVREGYSHSIDEPLTATALVLKGTNKTSVLISLDVMVLTIEFANHLRQKCAEVVVIQASDVLINCNHTHSGPATPGWFTYGPEDQMAMEAAYGELLLNNCVQACRDAVTSLQSARISIGWGECKGNINRRQLMPDGGVLLGENPDGACDSSVGVLRIDALDGQLIAVAFRYSCHTVTLGPKTNIISPDFIGPARRVVEGNLGCPAMFLQGCAGNINPASGIGQDADTVPHFKDEQLRLGHMLGGEILKVAQSMRSHRKRATPKLVKSVAHYWLYEYEAIPTGPVGNIQTKEVLMELPLAPFPTQQEAAAEKAMWQSALREAEQRGESNWVKSPLVRFNDWSQLRFDAMQNGPSPATLTFPVQVMQIGPLKIVAMPFETMAETGLALREELGNDTFVLGYSNGVISYLPTPEVGEEGGMEARLGYKNYMVPSEIPGSWEPIIKQQATELFSYF